MWGKIFTIIAAIIPYLIERFRREEVEADILKKQQEKADADTKEADTIRSGELNDNLLLNPKDRAPHNED